MIFKSRAFARFFFIKMVKKIDGIYFLNRSESVDYLVKAYDLKWCMTKWQNGRIKVCYENKQKYRGYFFINAYKIKTSKFVQVSQYELDTGMQIM